jgi:hypothetical protein
MCTDCERFLICDDMPRRTYLLITRIFISLAFVVDFGFPEFEGEYPLFTIPMADLTHIQLVGAITMYRFRTPSYLLKLVTDIFFLPQRTSASLSRRSRLDPADPSHHPNASLYTSTPFYPEHQPTRHHSPHHNTMPPQ